jgi:hypothetical protein
VSGWLSTSPLQASQFVPEEGGGQPDFSASGAPIRFGYSRRNNNGGEETVVWESGIDNFRVVVHRQNGCPGGPPLLRIDKTDHGHGWKDDPLIPYEITVTNVGGTAAAPRPVAEIVPVNTTWVAAASSRGGVALPDQARTAHAATCCRSCNQALRERWTSLRG